MQAHFLRTAHRTAGCRNMSTSPIRSAQRYKLVFYTPPAALEAIKAAVFAAGAGTHPGSMYSHCSFESRGVGQFLPIAERGANPAVGQKREDGSGEFRLERVEEVRCEIMCVGRDVVGEAVRALKMKHPYEAPAYEIYRMQDGF